MSSNIFETDEFMLLSNMRSCVCFVIKRQKKTEAGERSCYNVSKNKRFCNSNLIKSITSIIISLFKQHHYQNC